MIQKVSCVVVSVLRAGKQTIALGSPYFVSLFITPASPVHTGVRLVCGVHFASVRLFIFYFVFVTSKNALELGLGVVHHELGALLLL